MTLEAVARAIIARKGFDPATFDMRGFVAGLDRETKANLWSLAEAADAERFKGLYHVYFPDDGPLRRDLYPKHTEFFRSGKDYRSRLFQAANRIGKTVAGSFEGCAHATGLYKPWWQGRWFGHPTDGWAAGDTNETTRDIIQKELFGSVQFDGRRKFFDGTGMVPRDLIGSVTWKAGGVPDLVDTVRVKHIGRSGEWDGGWSTIGLKSYVQGRISFQGTAKHWIWLDEEPPMDVYNEATIRLMTTKGLMMITFTPLKGMSDVVMSFMDDQPDAVKRAAR